MSDIYAASLKDFDWFEHIDVQTWYSIYKIIPLGVSLVDRTCSIKFPFNIRLYEDYKMPAFDDRFSLNYADCCLNRARDLVKVSKELSVPITILYSGGIDSTAVLTSFKQVLSAAEFKELIIVALTPDSIRENHNFYFDHLRDQCRIISSQSFSNLITDKTIFVTGEHNDQLFGSDLVKELYQRNELLQVTAKYNKDYIIGYLKHKMNASHATIWLEVFDQHIKENQQYGIETNLDFFWWYNFCFKWQTVGFRMLLQQYDCSKFSDQFFRTHVYHFFSSKEFQLWSITSPQHRNFYRWEDYKLLAKKFIFDYNNDDVYYQTKIKDGSGGKLFYNRTINLALTSDYQILNTINYPQYYNQTNNFNTLINAN